MMREERNALIRARQQNINRYCQLLTTRLTDHERQFIHRRLTEERLELERNLLETAGRHAVEGSSATCP